MAEAIHEALTMPAKQREENQAKLHRYVWKHTAAFWGSSFVNELKVRAAWREPGHPRGAGGGADAHPATAAPLRFGVGSQRASEANERRDYLPRLNVQRVHEQFLRSFQLRVRGAPEASPRGHRVRRA